MLANGGGQDVVITFIYFRLKDWAKMFDHIKCLPLSY